MFKTKLTNKTYQKQLFKEKYLIRNYLKMKNFKFWKIIKKK